MVVHNPGGKKNKCDFSIELPLITKYVAYYYQVILKKTKFKRKINLMNECKFGSGNS